MKLYIRQFFLIGLGLMACLRIPAQHTYTLDECIDEALKNNVRIKNADNDLSVAKHGSKEAFTKYFPSLSATGGGFMADKGLIQLEMSPEMEMSILKNGIVGGVSASMPLFTGGQIVNANKLAKVNVEVSRLQHGLSVNEVKLVTERYFWQIVKLKEMLNTLSSVEGQLESIRKEVEASVDAGVTNRNDLLQVQLRKNETRSTRISVENALSVSRKLLAQYIGCASDSIDVAFDFGGTLPSHPDNLYRIPESVLVLTNEYSLLQQDVKASRLQYRMSVGKNLPSIAIGGGYMYDNLMDKDHSFWMGFATVSVPLSGWWGGSHEMKKHKLRLRNAENRFTDQSQLLIIRMQNTWNDLTDAYQQVEIAVESIGQATENLRLQTDYYHAGTCTMSDLLEAQTLYQQSRDKYVESYARYEVKKREYLQATGR
ncbi:TolC family protein [Parabacteroides johnsonii]|nr:TolC family protein [Parabacteroides johnsonii]